MKSNRRWLPWTVGLVILGNVAYLWHASSVTSTAGVSEPSAGSARTDPGGRIVIVDNVLDFGTRFDDEPVELALRVRNVGEGPLGVHLIKSGCGCATAAVPTEPVAPGREAPPILVTVKLNGMTGPFERVGFVMSDDPTTPRAPFTIRGEVRYRYVIEPTTVALVEDRPGAGAEQELIIRRADGHPVGPAEILCDASGVEATRLEEPDGDPAIARFRVRMADVVEVHTALRIVVGAQRRFVKLTARPGRDVQARPGRVAMGMAYRNEPTLVDLVGREGVSWSVAGVETDRPDLRADCVEQKVRILWTSAAPDGVVSGKVTVTLDGARPEQLSIPVTALIGGRDDPSLDANSPADRGRVERARGATRREELDRRIRAQRR